MTTAYDVHPQKLVEATTEELKSVEEVQPPEWAAFTKSGVSRERPPQSIDWWYSRAASLLRRVYAQGPVGVRRLRNHYGGRKNRGHQPEKFYPGGGSSIRKILQQLEDAGLVETRGKKGRVASAEGQRFLDNIAHKMKTGK